jgi:hypothetical protein
MQFNNTNQNIKVVNPDKPFCMQCGVNLSERSEIIKSGTDFDFQSIKEETVIDRMQEDGYLGEFDECLRSKILITKEKFVELYGEEI